MNYKKLIEAHRLFYTNYAYGASLYDDYMRSKNLEMWSSPTLPMTEIKKLFKFIKMWDCFFQGDEEKFQRIYEEIYPIIKELENEEIEHVDLTDDELTRKIRFVFDKVARTPLMKRYESTDASKILHTIIPSLFVMWDNKIKEWTMQNRRMGAAYAFFFLPKIQKELEEAIKTCVEEINLSNAEAIIVINIFGWTSLV